MKGFNSLICLFLLTFSQLSGADSAGQLETRIHDVIQVKSQGADRTRVLTTADGRIYRVASSKKALLRQIKEAASSHRPVRLEVANEEIIALRPLTEVEARDYADLLQPAADSVSVTDLEFSNAYSDTVAVSDPLGLGYQASNLGRMEDASNIFSRLKPLSHRSQCYQRAHYWARQMYSAGNVYSMKSFLFFTRKFVREHDYKWWFHVAPYVYVQGTEIVLDPEFVNAPKTMQEWTDFFMMDRHFVSPPLYTAPNCPSISRYTEFENNQESSLCYVLKLPMYYYQPIDAENLDLHGTRVEFWRPWDTKHSDRAD